MVHYIKEYLSPGLQRAGQAWHYKCHEENKRKNLVKTQVEIVSFHVLLQRPLISSGVD